MESDSLHAAVFFELLNCGTRLPRMRNRSPIRYLDMYVSARFRTHRACMARQRSGTLRVTLLSLLGMEA